MNSAEEATAFVTAAHFPPDGRRSYGPHRMAWAAAGELSPGDWTRAQNAAVETYAMVETRGARRTLPPARGEKWPHLADGGSPRVFAPAAAQAQPAHPGPTAIAE